MDETITTGAKYLSLRRGERYHFIAQRPDDMPEDVWDDVSQMLSDALQSHLNRSSRARDFLKRANLTAGISIPYVEGVEP